MSGRSTIANWPWRRWFLAGAAMAGTSTTLAGPIAAEGGCGTSWACNQYAPESGCCDAGAAESGLGPEPGFDAASDVAGSDAKASDAGHDATVPVDAIPLEDAPIADGPPADASTGS